MILTVSLNPAIDRTCEVEKLSVGEVNRICEAKSVAGGKGINVTKVLRQFDMPVTATGFLGGAGGTMIEKTVRDMEAVCVFTNTVANTRMNTNVVAKDGTVTEILEPGAEILEGEMQTFLMQFEALSKEAKVIVLSGSLPLGIPDDFYCKLIKIGHEAGSVVILDTSKEALKEAVDSEVDCIKPNKKELEALIGRELKDEGEIVEAAKELVSKGIKKVVVSMGEKGLMMVTKDKTLCARPPKIKAVNTVGCGDSAVAALAMGFYEKEEDEEVLKMAAAISAANALTLENGDIPKKELQKIYESVNVRTIV